MDVGKDLGRSETERGFGNEPYYRAGEDGAAEHGVADLGAQNGTADAFVCLGPTIEMLPMVGFKKKKKEKKLIS